MVLQISCQANIVTTKITVQYNCTPADYDHSLLPYKLYYNHGLPANAHNLASDNVLFFKISLIYNPPFCKYEIETMISKSFKNFRSF